MVSLENKGSLILDIFFCVVFMPVLIALGPAGYWLNCGTVFFMTACVFFYGCYFAVKHIRFPKLFIAGRYREIAGWLAALVVGNWLLTQFPLPDLDFVTPSMSAFQTSVRDYSITLSLWLIFSLVIGYSVSVAFVKELYGQVLLQKRLEHQRDKAELAIFKAQISPHFLFNTLNSLYSLVIGTSQKAEDAFIKFTEILKYTYIIIDNDLVSVKDEITYIQNYIDLQELRLNRHTMVKWSHDVDNEGYRIPPMILLTFVENAFKYGVSTTRDCVIEISLAIAGGVLRFRTCNSVMKHVGEFRTELPVGLDNCRARLSGIYPGKYILDTYERDGIFNLDLTIKLV